MGKRKYFLNKGDRFGEWTIISDGLVRRPNGKWGYLCKCSCGKEKVIQAHRLVDGHTTSCGCKKQDRFYKIITKHGLSKTRLNHTYRHMKDRCYNPKCNSYKSYGARGIKMCDEWLNDFVAFYNWALANGYKEDLTIERVDVNGDYCPENCTWIPMGDQAKNRQNSRLITCNGETRTITEWSRITGHDATTIRRRLNAGLSPEEALTLEYVSFKTRKRDAKGRFVKNDV